MPCLVKVTFFVFSVEHVHLAQLVVFARLRILLAFLEEVDDGVGRLDLPRVVVRLARDDQWCAGLVDQDGVDLVDDAVAVATLHLVLEPPLHVVAKVVEAELVVRAVGYVGRVGLLLRPVVLVRADDSRRQAEVGVDGAHPGGVASGEVVVDGDDVDTLARQRVEVGGGHACERLSLTGLHLEDVALVEDDGAHDLDVVVLLAKHPEAGLAGQGEGLGQDGVKTRPACRDLGLPGLGLGLHLLLAEPFGPGGLLIDCLHDRVQALHVLVVFRAAEEGGQYVLSHATKDSRKPE